MYKYAYETISCNLEGWGLGAGNVYCIDEYRSIIDKRATQGWRYVGYIPVKQRGTGHVDYSLVIAPVVADLCTTPVALSAPPNSYQNNSQS
mgnify:CR=1 FL=1